VFRRDQGRWQDREVHAHLTVPGHIETVNHAILHSDAPCIASRIRNLDRYTRYEADELRKQNVRFAWHDVIVRPLAAFLYRYIRLQGFRDGWRGFIQCTYSAMYVFLTRAKLWELEELKMERSRKTVQALPAVQSDQR